MSEYKILDETYRLMMTGELGKIAKVVMTEEKKTADIQVTQLRIDGLGTKDTKVVLSAGGYDLFELPFEYGPGYGEGESLTLNFDGDQYFSTRLTITS